MSDNRIMEIISIINSDEIIPAGWLKRNHLQYPLVCNVNNVICLHLSNNLYDFLLDRIKKELQKVKVDDLKNDYIELVYALIELLKKVSKPCTE